MMSELYDELVPIYGRNDNDMKIINKMLRDIVVKNN